MGFDLISLIAGVFLILGSFFLLVGSVGILRMPDIFSRMHAISVSETAGLGFILVGLMIVAGFSLVTFKLVVLFLLIFFTAPVASHAVARAALADGIEPVLDGPELDAREGEPVPMVGKKSKVVTAIDASEAETSAGVFAEDAEQEGEGK